MSNRIFIRILGYLLPYKRHFIIGSILAFAFSITNGATLYSIVPLFNTLTPGNENYQIKLDTHELDILRTANIESLGDRITYIKVYIIDAINSIIMTTDKFSLLIYICSALLIIFLIRTILRMLVVYYIGYAGNGAIKDIRRAIFSSMISLPLSFFHRQKTGELISKVIYDTDLISGSLSNQLRKFIVNVFIIITHLGLLLYINSGFTLLAILMLVVITVPIMLMGKHFKRYSMIEQESVAEISSMVLETINGTRIVKSYQMEDFLTGRFLKSAKTLFVKKFNKAMIDISRPHIVEIIASFFAVYLYISGGKMVISGEYSYGEFLFFVLTFLFIMNPMKQIANMNNQIKQAEAAGERVFTIIDEQAEPFETDFLNSDSAAHAEKPAITITNIIVPESEIRFENVSFQYPSSTEPVIKNINLTIKAGERAAIVGRSGTGKTTLVDLIPRFYKPGSGRICIDGIDIETFPLKKVRNSIGIVTQEVFLFNGTISENIAYGRNVHHDSIREAAIMANASDFIEKTPEGYNTVIGERGIMLSGGERQRIAIARSILRNSPILILDEATSSLDTESERLVQGALDRLMSSRTTFVIAHRLSTIVNADKIVVLDNGMIAEQGTHAELIGKMGLYKKLYDIQFADEGEGRFS